MGALKEPDRITLTEGLTLLERHVPTEEAKRRLRQAFVHKACNQIPLFAFPYDQADIDWAIGSVKIPRKRDRFSPTLSRAAFNAYFLRDEPAGSVQGTKSMAERQPHAALHGNREDARRLLEERIQAADSIIAGPSASHDDLSNAQERERNWRAHNRDLLSRMFTTDQYVNEYDGARTPVHQVGDHYDDPSVNSLASRLTASVNQHKLSSQIYYRTA
jgi:hypothetical protein